MRKHSISSILCLVTLASAIGVSADARAEGGTLGLGLNTSLTPRLGSVSTVTPLVVPAFSLRIWADELMIEPLLGIGLAGGDGNDADFFMSGGFLVGWALSLGRLRPFIGGGLRLAVATSGALGVGGGTNVGLTFGPMMGFEYRFEDLPDLGLDLALSLPLNMQFDPFFISFGTAGAVQAGFHYYF